MKFNVGDRAVLVGSTPVAGRKYIGKVTTILALRGKELGGDDLYEIDLVPPGYLTATCPARHLKPLYDGHETCSWEDCVWKPDLVEA